MLLQHNMFLLPSLTVWPIPRVDAVKARYTKYVFPTSPEQDSVPHNTTTHPLTIWALQAAKSGFLSLPLPLPLLN